MVILLKQAMRAGRFDSLYIEFSSIQSNISKCFPRGNSSVRSGGGSHSIKRGLPAEESFFRVRDANRRAKQAASREAWIWQRRQVSCRVLRLNSLLCFPSPKRAEYKSARWKRPVDAINFNRTPLEKSPAPPIDGNPIRKVSWPTFAICLLAMLGTGLIYWPGGLAITDSSRRPRSASNERDFAIRIRLASYSRSREL